MERWDIDAIGPLLAPEVVFHSPVTHRAFHGRPAVVGLLRHVAATFEDFRYTDELAVDGMHLLVFAARVGDRELQGIDLLRFDRAGLISDFTVMIRPLSGLIPFAQAMAERVAGDR
ncbi:MAG: nuclear transport factor 2 family protein [Solirubrobacteraceae bacterium]